MLDADRYPQVHLKSEGEKLLLILPKAGSEDPTAGWSEIWQEFKYCLTHHEGTWPPGTPVRLLAQDRLLDGRHLQDLAEALREVGLSLTHLHTNRRQTAVAAAAAGYSVEQAPVAPSLLPGDQPPPAPLADPLYLRTTVRSGAAIRHPGPVIVWGDVNPGGEVIADGDIIIWGGLRGIAQAGAKGNRECCIAALRMEPTQLRIAEWVARAPAAGPKAVEPEVACLTPEGIRLTAAAQFSRSYEFDPAAKAWTEKKSEVIQYVNAQKRLEEELKKVEKDR